MPSLFVISTDERYPLTPGEHVAGRLQSCALTLNEVQASRRQFALRSRGSRWTVCDLGSRNGTSLNAQRLTETPVPLHHGDRISVGETVIRYDVELASLARRSREGWVLPPLFRARLAPQFASAASRTTTELIPTGMALDVVVRVTVPSGATFAGAPSDASLESVDGASMRLSSARAEGELTVRREYRIPRTRVSVEDYPGFARFCRDADDAESAEIRVRM